MEMMGIHSCSCNKHNPLGSKCPQLQIANQLGDLDLYVEHHDQEQCKSKNIGIIWEAISKWMHVALLQASEQMVEELQKAAVIERVHSAGAGNFVSSDLLVNNVGVLESYQSPPHIDKSDIGWTFTFACKCSPWLWNTLVKKTN